MRLPQRFSMHRPRKFELGESGAAASRAGSVGPQTLIFSGIESQLLAHRSLRTFPWQLSRGLGLGGGGSR